MEKTARTAHSVVAAAREDARFKAVEVRKQDGVVEILWARSLPADSRTWTDFAAACGFATSADGRGESQRKYPASVVGLDSTGVAFYRISVPTVGADEMAAIVRMQAESLLPLPSDQIEVAWRTTPSTNGKIDITIAAARGEYLLRFADSVRSFRPNDILLSCEGTARAWRDFFSDREREALIASLGAENTQVCLVQNGLVTHAAVLDTGMNHLASSNDDAAPGQVMERFAQDMRTILGTFGWNESSDWPVLVLSDGTEVIDRVVESLSAAGLHARATTPRAHNVRMPSGFEMRHVYEYRVPLGLAMAALETPTQTLDLFERIKESDERKAKSIWNSVVLAGAAAAVMLVLLLIVWRSVDVSLAKRLDTQMADPNFQAARQRQVLLKTVARHRPDILQLLADLSAGQNAGIALDSLYFKKGQAVTIMGQAGNMDQMYTFQDGLREQRGIADVEIPNATRDPKTKKIKFTMTFHYKNYTKKDAVL